MKQNITPWQCGKAQIVCAASIDWGQNCSIVLCWSVFYCMFPTDMLAHMLQHFLSAEHHTLVQNRQSYVHREGKQFCRAVVEIWPQRSVGVFTLEVQCLFACLCVVCCTVASAGRSRGSLYLSSRIVWLRQGIFSAVMQLAELSFVPWTIAVA